MNKKPVLFFLGWIVVIVLSWPLLQLADKRLAQDFNSSWSLLKEAIAPCSAVIAGILSIKGTLYKAEHSAAFLQSIRPLVLALLLLSITACLKAILYGWWVGGDFSADFSSDFDHGPRNFNEVSHKPQGWLVYVLYGAIWCAYLCFIVGVHRFLRILFLIPRSNVNVAFESGTERDKEPEERNMHTEKTNLKTLTPEKINAIYDEQCLKQHWTFSDEREHMENLFCQRLNFLLVVYALIVAGLVATSDKHLFIGILWTGTIITLLLGLSLWRICSKVLLMFAICYRIKNHPIDVVDNENAEHGLFFRGFRANHFLGYFIPAICFLSLVAALICLWCGVLVPGKVG